MALWFQQTGKTHEKMAGWETLNRSDFKKAAKTDAIAEIESLMESKYLRYCDPSEPLHMFTSIIIRSSICKMKIFAYSIRGNTTQHHHQPSTSQPQQPSPPTSTTATSSQQSDRDIVFSNALKLLEYVIMIQSGANGLQKFAWNIGTSHVWTAILYVLLELRHRKSSFSTQNSAQNFKTAQNDNKAIDKAWHLIGQTFEHFPHRRGPSSHAVFRAMEKWTVQVWDECAEAAVALGQPEKATPAYILEMRRRRATAFPLPAEGLVSNTATTGAEVPGMLAVDDAAAALPPLSAEAASVMGGAAAGPVGGIGGGGGMLASTAYDFPDLMAFETDPNEWLNWDRLIAEEGGFA
jgi:hypothetical protein